jgi:hypothetical protein
MVHFLQLTQTSSPVAVAVAHFTRRVLFIQRWAWVELNDAECHLVGKWDLGVLGRGRVGALAASKFSLTLAAQ